MTTQYSASLKPKRDSPCPFQIEFRLKNNATQIKRNNLINVGVYVARIFGGSLLGVPGLIQSYSTATLSAIDNIEHYRWIQSSTVLFSLTYELEGIFKSLIKDFNAKIISSTYLDEIEMLVSIDDKSLISFIDKTKNISSNKIKYKLTG